MKPAARSNAILGVTCILFALLVIFVWVPFDVETGIVEKVRRRVVIGDSLAPTLAAAFVGLGGMLLLLFERRSPDQKWLELRSIRFIAVALLMIVCGLVLMRYAGPLAVAIANAVAGSEDEYRLLRDTQPWKIIGFLPGGVIVAGGLIAQAERRMRARSILVALLISLALIAVFDLPFDDLLLPPNGDV